MAGGLRFTVRIEGADEVIRALDKLPKDARDAMKAQAKDIATSLADFIKLGGRAHSRQAARAARTVRESSEGFWPVITANNSSGLLFGSIFGMTRKSGWYAKRRYFNSRGSNSSARGSDTPDIGSFLTRRSVSRGLSRSGPRPPTRLSVGGAPDVSPSPPSS